MTSTDNWRASCEEGTCTNREVPPWLTSLPSPNPSLRPSSFRLFLVANGVLCELLRTSSTTRRSSCSTSAKLRPAPTTSAYCLRVLTTPGPREAAPQRPRPERGSLREDLRHHPQRFRGDASSRYGIPSPNSAGRTRRSRAMKPRAPRPSSWPQPLFVRRSGSGDRPPQRSPGLLPNAAVPKGAQLRLGCGRRSRSPTTRRCAWTPAAGAILVFGTNDCVPCPRPTALCTRTSSSNRSSASSSPFSSTTRTETKLLLNRYHIHPAPNSLAS